MCALLLKASGPHFSAGADVPAMFEGLSAHAAEAHLAKHIPLMERLQDLPIPTIAAVRGMCLTAGLEIVLRCDVLWASETAQFAQLEAMIGATTLLGGAQILTERAGPARATELIRAAAEGGASTADRLVGLVGAPLLETHDMQAGVQAVAKHGARNFSAKFAFQGK